MRILLAEDHTELREAIARRLRALGNSVDEVSSLREIRTYLNGAHYDVGVFDRMLPDGDSLTLLQALRTAANRTPILLPTAPRSCCQPHPDPAADSTRPHRRSGGRLTSRC